MAHVIRLEAGHYYIGDPKNIIMHFLGKSAQKDMHFKDNSNEWYTKYAPIKLEGIVPHKDVYRVILEFKALYGEDKIHVDKQNKPSRQMEYWLQDLEDMRGYSAIETVEAMRELVRDVERVARADVGAR